MIKGIMFLADQAGCGHARIKIQNEYLQKQFSNRIDTRVSDLMNPEEWMDANKNRIIDFVVLQRQHGGPNLNNTLYMQKKLGIKCIYECDDALFHVPQWSPAYSAYNAKQHPQRMSNIEKFLRTSDAITVSTDCLKRMFSKYNNNIYVLKNALDFQYYQNIKKKNNFGEIYLGWIGSNTHLNDLKQAVSAIEQIMKEFPQVKLFLGGWDGKIKTSDGKEHPHLYVWKNIPKNRIITNDWVNDFHEYAKMISNIDIGIAPLEDIAFNRAKSNIKVLEYWASKVPVIASNVEPYADTINHGENGFLVRAKGAVHDDWYKKIKELVVNEQLRQQFSEAGYQKAFEQYNIEKNISQWLEVYEKTCRA